MRRVASRLPPSTLHVPQVWFPKRTRRRGAFAGVRVGEAAHPGPPKAPKAELRRRVVQSMADGVEGVAKSVAQVLDKYLGQFLRLKKQKCLKIS